MFVVVRRTGLVGSPAEAARHAREHVVPLLRRQPGFLGCCGFVTATGDAAYSVGVFEDRDAAMEAHRRVRAWIDANLRDLMPEGPEVVAGEAVFHAVARPREQGGDERPLFVVVRTYHGLPGQAETMHSLVSLHTLPAITGAPGFRGFYAFRDEAEPDRAVSVTLYDTRAEALRSHERVVGIMRERLGEMAYATPRAAMGETVVLATA
jgi:hypothetical protein